MEAWNLPIPNTMLTKHGEFTITLHAMKRFYNRYVARHPELSKEQADSIEFFYKKLFKHLNTAKEVERKNAIWQLLEHDMEPARYYRSKGGHGPWIFVVGENNSVITCFPFEPSKWKMYRIKKLTELENPDSMVI